MVGQLYQQYKDNEEYYPRYLNFNGIDVSKVNEIPKDFMGYMGVPDSFLERYNPEQFKIIGLSTGDAAKKIGISKNYRGRTDLSFLKNGKAKCPFSRVVIQRRKQLS